MSGEDFRDSLRTERHDERRECCRVCGMRTAPDEMNGDVCVYCADVRSARAEDDL